MKLHALSDLHLEFAPFDLPKTDADVLVLAGDTGSSKVDYMRQVNEWSKRRPVVMVLGNHEFYGAEFPTLYDKVRQQAGPNVHVLQNQSLVLGRVRFLGCTLWTDYNLNNYRQTDEQLDEAQWWLNDYVQIHKMDGQTFHPLDSVAAHMSSRHWLEQELAQNFAGPTVIVTHHSPSPRSITGEHAPSEMNPAYHSNLEYLMSPTWPSQPQLWIHGHTHASLYYKVGQTRVVSNARGYPHERTGYNPALVVEV